MPKDQTKSNPNDDEDENHNNTPCRVMPRLDQDPEHLLSSSDSSEEAMNSEEAMEALGESLGLIKPETDIISAPQGATAMPQPQYTEQNCGNNTFGFVTCHFPNTLILFYKQQFISNTKYEKTSWAVAQWS
jgi:hypothetical protein